MKYPYPVALILLYSGLWYKMSHTVLLFSRTFSHSGGKDKKMKKYANQQSINENGEYYLKADRQKIPVSKEVYHAVKDPVRAEDKRRRREWRCRNGNGVRCMKDCMECTYYRMGGEPTGNTLSLDRLHEDNEYEAADSVSVEDIVMETIILEELFKALDELDPRSRRICELIMAGNTDREMAAEFGITQSTFNYQKHKMLEQLRERLKKFM